MAYRYRVVAVGLANKCKYDTLFIGDLPPHGRIHEDTIGLAVARVDYDCGSTILAGLFLSGIRNVEDVLTGIVLAIGCSGAIQAAIVREGCNTYDYGTAACCVLSCLNLNCGGSPKLCFALLAAGHLEGQSLTIISCQVLRCLLSCYGCCRVVQTIAKSVAVCERVVVTGVGGHPAVDTSAVTAPSLLTLT